MLLYECLGFSAHWHSEVVAGTPTNGRPHLSMVVVVVTGALVVIKLNIIIMIIVLGIVMVTNKWLHTLWTAPEPQVGTRYASLLF